ncbi:BTAD domain-containing putative transcriptional regulator [Streptomyces sp. NPDC020965]|uniref:BTAD domain-containing putative transcriptional regulator n=1 Tax=Streptomyces sp. NPDC020965 TaxID=3365105 RepID=UPI0037BDB352
MKQFNESVITSDDISVKLRLLGNTELIAGDRSYPPGDPLQRGLLATLAMRANNRVGAEALAAALWENPPRTALRQIQTKVWKLRELLDYAFATESVQQRPQLINQAGGYLLFVEPTSIDLVLFNTFVKEARKTAAEGDFERSAQRYRDALSLWRGPAFADISAPEMSAPGIRAEAIKLQDHYITVTEERIEADLILGRHNEVISELQYLVRRHPLRERFRLHLIRALGRMGRRTEASEAYLEGHRLLVQELGLDLSPDLTEAHRVILAGGPPPAKRTVVRQVSASGTAVLTDGNKWAMVAGGRGHQHDLAQPIPVIPTQGREHRQRGPATADVRLLNSTGRGGDRDRPPAHLEPVLEQLLNGATDLTASRRLGLSPRTFSRRVSELLEYLGVATRFQAGAEAYNRGWITVRPEGPSDGQQSPT